MIMTMHVHLLNELCKYFTAMFERRMWNMLLVVVQIVDVM